MRKPIPQIQSDLVNAIGNIGFVGTDGENGSNKCKSNAIEIIKSVIHDLDEFKSIQAERDKYREAMDTAIYELDHLRKKFPELPDSANVARHINTIKRDLESALKEEESDIVRKQRELNEGNKWPDA